MRIAIQLGVFVALILPPMSVQARTGIDLSVYVGSFGSGTPNYSAAPDPTFFLGQSGWNFQTGIIESADHQYIVTGQIGGWSFQEPTFHSLPALLHSLDQTWTMKLDQGLPTEKDYTFSFHAGSLAQTGLPPAFVYNAPNGTMEFSTFTPKIWLSLPAIPNLYDLRLVTNPPITGTTLFDAFVPGGTPYFQIQQHLTPGYYSFSVNGNGPLPTDSGFSVPVDANNTPLTADWTSWGTASYDTGVLFTVVPEPSSFCLLIAAGVVGLTRCVMRRRAS